jgi:hypothetical protein
VRHSDPNSALFGTASGVNPSERHRLPAATVRLVSTGGVVQNFCLTGGHLRNVGLEALHVVAIGRTKEVRQWMQPNSEEINRHRRRS